MGVFPQLMLYCCQARLNLQDFDHRTEAPSSMQVELGSITLPITTDVEIDIKVRAQTQISATAAQRRVSRLVLDRVSNLLCGNPPSLVIAERLRWRVPVWLGLPKHGLIGKVGEIDVDVETGEMIFDENTLEELRERADALARRTLSATN